MCQMPNLSSCYISNPRADLACSRAFPFHNLPATALQRPQLLVMPVTHPSLPGRPLTLRASLHALRGRALRLRLVEAGVTSGERAELPVPKSEVGGGIGEGAATVGTYKGNLVCFVKAGAGAVYLASGPQRAATVLTSHLCLLLCFPIHALDHAVVATEGIHELIEQVSVSPRSLVCAFHPDVGHLQPQPGVGELLRQVSVHQGIIPKGTAIPGRS